MADYSIVLKGIGEGGRKIYTSLNSDITKKVRMKVYNTYFDFPELVREKVYDKDLQYWDQIVTNSCNRYVEFRDDTSWELVGLFGLEGEIDLKDYDYDSYAKRISKLLPKDKVGNVCHVFNEIVCQKVYWGDFVDIEENDVVVDIGFNFGLFSTTSLHKKPSKILGFEPNPNLVKIFEENFKGDKIQLYNYAVSDRNSKVTFYENGDYGMSTIKEDLNLEHRTKKYEVDCISINSLISSFNLEKIDYLKVDCEGSEYEIFESISEVYLANNIRKIVMEFHGFLYSEKVQRILSKLRRCGFETIVSNQEGVPLGMIYAKKII